VKKSALFSTFCVSMFAAIPAVANAEDVQQLIAKCAASVWPSRPQPCAKISKLRDQDLLAKIALGAKYAHVRTEAVERLEDRALLAKIAVEDQDAGVRGAAFRGLGVAFSRLKDDALLAKIALTDEAPVAREVAASRLSDDALLAKIAVEDQDAGVRGAAVERLGNRLRDNHEYDGAFMARVAAEDKDADVRRLAVANLTNGALLAKVAIDGEDATVAEFAALRLTMVLRLGRNELLLKAPGVRSNIVVKVPNTVSIDLDDKALLTRLAVRAKDASLRQAAVGWLTDQSLLAKIAVEDRDPGVRAAAQRKLR
jgi:hypothetical protein